ncbi:uncharacterized protein [Spinacia oleracea]|uniref:Uncharacterized protein isoform X2 n=1 Tax=Spinacia oleracea TaxID=3562 RepID=A0ABM3QGQ9_SPIOL|nr:uncharacterized protein LOC110789522 isoform X2 [Spinacia oleracea]
MASLINSPSHANILSPRSFLITLFLVSSLLQLSLCHQLKENEEEERIRRRKLLGFKEKAAGSNTTFECSPSGPCVPCQYSEKKDDKYRCSETGYRIPFKCIRSGDVTKGASGNVPENSHPTEEGSVNADNAAAKHRLLADKSSKKKGKREPKEYVTYRSCIQGVNEEKLSVLGFEEEKQKMMALALAKY